MINKFRKKASKSKMKIAKENANVKIGLTMTNIAKLDLLIKPTNKKRIGTTWHIVNKYKSTLF